MQQQDMQAIGANRITDPLDSGSFSLLALSQIIWGRKWTVTLFFLVFVGFSILSSLRGEDTYTAGATLVLEENTADLTNALSRDTQLYADTNTAVQVFGSRRVLERVVDRMDLVSNPVFNPFLEASGATAPGPVARIVQGLRAHVGDSDDNGDSRMTSEGPDETVIRQTVTSALERRISFQTTPVNQLILVSATTVDPKLSAELADTVAEEFLADLLRTRLAALDSVVEQMGRGVAELRQSVREQEQTLQDFISTNKFVDPTIVEQRREALVRVRVQLARLEAEIARDKTLLTEIDALESVSASDIALAFSSSSDLAQQTSDFGPIRTPDDLAELRAALQARLDLNSRRLSGLQEGFGEREREVEAQSEQLLLYHQLERDLLASEEILAFSIRRLNELSIQSGVEGGGGRIVLPAEVPLNPDGSGAIRSAIVMGLLGIFTGIGWVLIRETTNQRLRTVTDVAPLLPNTRAIAIPKAPRGRLGNRKVFEQTLLLRTTPDPYADALRRIRMALLQNTSPSDPLVVHVTSDLAATTKTLLTIGLARSYSLIGKKVLVMEANMRQAGVMAEIVKIVPPDICLQDVITGLASVDEAILTHQELEVDFLLAGTNRAHPSDLLAVDSFDAVVAAAARDFDVILIDTPPLLTAAGESLNIKANRTLFIADSQASTVKSLLDALTELPNGRAVVDVIGLYGADERYQKRYSRNV